MASGIMEYTRALDRRKGTLCQTFLIFAIWFSAIKDVAALRALAEESYPLYHNEHTKSPNMGLFEPIQISPSVIPRYPIPSESSAPLYPTFPITYEPVLTGKCLVNFSDVASIVQRTAADCSQPFAPLVGNVICCPQFGSLLHIFQGYSSSGTNNLVLEDDLANDCFTDIIAILASRGANSSIPGLCSVKPSNLTGGSCPVKDITTFEKIVNTSQLLDACSTVDQLRECCRPVCQPAIADAAMRLFAGHSTARESKNMVDGAVTIGTLNDCKGVIYSWLSRKLSADAANTVFRRLSSCKVNRVCPLEFTVPSKVVKDCRNRAAPSPSCCSSLNSYIAGIQKQMLITNKQAIICAMTFGSMLQKAGVLTNVFELCDVDLKDFSLQVTAFGQQGCLLRSLPADVIFDNATGYGFTCDLNDNIGAPWPKSSSVSSFSLCAPEMSLPALPTSKKSESPGQRQGKWGFIAAISSFVMVSVVLY